MKILQRYILLELAGPFLVSLSLLTFILFMRQMVFLFPKIAGKNLDWSVIIEVIILSLPFILALVLPMAVLVAVIMAFGRLSADNEITALKGLGVAAHRLLKTPLGAAFFLMLGAIWFNDRVLPESNHRYKNLLMDIAYLKPSLNLREGVIMDDFPGMGLLVNRIKDSERRRNLSLTAPDAGRSVARDAGVPAELYGVVITQNESSGARRTIVADSGSLAFTPDHKDGLLTLYHGEIQEVDPQHQEKFQRLFFDRHRIRLPDVGGTLERGRGGSYRGDRELSLGMIEERIAQRRADIDSLYHLAGTLLDSLLEEDSARVFLHGFLNRPAGKRLSEEKSLPAWLKAPGEGRYARQLNDPRVRLSSLLRESGFLENRIASLEVEYWKKIAIPFASLVFVLLGVPLGILSRKGGAGVSLAISMFIFLVYWIFLISGETLADHMLLSPFWSMWAANAVFLTVGLGLLTVQVRGRRSLSPAGSGLGLNIRGLFRRSSGRAEKRGRRP